MRRAAWILALLLAQVGFPALVAATGSTLVHSWVVNVAQGVLLEGEEDRYPDLVGGTCAFPAVGRSQLYLAVEGALPGDLVVLWTLEEDAFGRWSWVEHPAQGTPPVALGRTTAPYFTCPAFRVEAREAAAAVGYTVLACHLVPTCPDHVPALGV